MTDKRERRTNAVRLSDEDIERAARGLVAADPSPGFLANVMRRLRDVTPERAGYVPAERLRRWQFACGALAMLLVAIVALTQVRRAEPTGATRVASDAKAPVVGSAHTGGASGAGAATGAGATGEAREASGASAPRGASGAAAVSRSQVASHRAPEDVAPVPTPLTRVVGPRLAERVGRRGAAASAPWDLMAPAQPEQSAVDLLPGLAALEPAPLPVPPPLVIPPIIIPELFVK